MTDRYFIRQDLQNIVDGPTGLHSTVPIIDAATLCEWLQKARDNGFKAGCDACHPNVPPPPAYSPPDNVTLNEAGSLRPKRGKVTA